MLFKNKGKIMNEKEFWKIISMFNWKYQGDDEKIMSKAVNYLSKKSNEAIIEFQEILSEFLYNLDGILYARNIGDESYKDDSKYFSVDWFLYSRCCVVANGKDFYYQVLYNPVKMPKNLEFESLLYLADAAYIKKNNKELDIITKFSCETFSNEKKWR